MTPSGAEPGGVFLGRRPTSVHPKASIRRGVFALVDTTSRLLRLFLNRTALLPSPPYSGGEGLGGLGEKSSFDVVFRRSPLTPDPSPLSTGERGESVRCATVALYC